jgi:hypothetical protein
VENSYPTVARYRHVPGLRYPLYLPRYHIYAAIHRYHVTRYSTQMVVSDKLRKSDENEDNKNNKREGKDVDTTKRII